MTDIKLNKRGEQILKEYALELGRELTAEDICLLLNEGLANEMVIIPVKH